MYSRSDLILIGYTDSSFQSNSDSIKSTLGSIFTLRGKAKIKSIEKSYIVNFIMEAEYMAPFEAAKKEIWLCKFLMDLLVIHEAAN